MKTNTDPQIIRTAYLNLPKPTKEWISSETSTYLIEEISDRLGLDEKKSAVIPNLILRLITQDLEPTDFINEISGELEINWQAAKAVAEDIEKKVLRPIENDLRREVGIDLKLIYFGKPRAAIPLEAPPALARSEGPMGGLPLTGPPPSHPTEWEKLRRPTPSEPIVDLQTFKIKNAPPVQKLPEKPAEKIAKEEITEPFLLHQENYSAAAPAAKEPPKNQPGLNIKVQNYSEAGEAPKTPPKPVSAKIELPAQATEMKTNTQNLVANINEQKTRVVHYNEMRTPLNNLGMPKESPVQNRLDLRKFTKPEINTVDLRKLK